MSRQITVLRTWIIREGTGDKGPWALRGVEANDAEGHPISEQLKTFSNLPLGEVEVEVERQDHPQYGVSYLLKTTGGRRGGGGGGGSSAGDLGELRERIARLESQVARLSSLVDRRELDEPGPPVAAGGIPDDDIPF